MNPAILQASSENFWNVEARSINKPRAEVSVNRKQAGVSMYVRKHLERGARERTLRNGAVTELGIPES